MKKLKDMKKLKIYFSIVLTIIGLNVYAGSHSSGSHSSGHSSSPSHNSGSHNTTKTTHVDRFTGIERVAKIHQITKNDNIKPQTNIKSQSDIKAERVAKINQINKPSNVKSESTIKSERVAKINQINGKTYKTPDNRVVTYPAYNRITYIPVNQYHYYHSGNNWLWWYLIYNYHTHRQDTIKANSKQELDNKVKTVSSSNSW
jgi:hypothetical protein